jgi:ABC-type glycerol-3-phosphate transport system permease component
MALDTAPKGWRSFARYSMLTIVALFILFPVYTTVIAALKPGNKVLDNPLVPNAFTLDVLKNAWTEGRLGRYLMNTTIVAVIVTSVQLVTSIASAYAFSFFNSLSFKNLLLKSINLNLSIMEVDNLKYGLLFVSMHSLASALSCFCFP